MCRNAFLPEKNCETMACNKCIEHYKKKFDERLIETVSTTDPKKKDGANEPQAQGTASSRTRANNKSILYDKNGRSKKYPEEGNGKVQSDSSKGYFCACCRRNTYGGDDDPVELAFDRQLVVAEDLQSQDPTKVLTGPTSVDNHRAYWAMAFLRKAKDHGGKIPHSCMICFDFVKAGKKNSEKLLTEA